MEYDKIQLKEIIDFSIRKIENKIYLILICDTKQHSLELISTFHKSDNISFHIQESNQQVTLSSILSHMPNVEMRYETGYKLSDYKPFEWLLKEMNLFLTSGYYTLDKEELAISTSYFPLLRIR